jgi:hypothetical protein
MYVQMMTYLVILVIGAGAGSWAGFRYGQYHATRVLGQVHAQGHRNAIRAWRDRS